MVSLIKTGRMTEMMRSKVIDLRARRVLVSRIEGSEQQTDLTAAPNAAGYGRVRHFRRAVRKDWPPNPLPIEPAARWLNMSCASQVRAQVFQVAGCAWRCWYCYVPFNMLSADIKRSAWKSASELLDLYWAECNRPPIIDLSGGSPDLVPEWITWMMDAIEEAGRKSSIYLWSDDNLSSDYLLTDRRELLSRMESYGSGYGKVCCLKGFDPVSFSFNTGADPSGFEEQLRILSGYAKSEIDLYLYVTLTSPPRPVDRELVGSFVERLGHIRADLPARTVMLHVDEFNAMLPRMNETRRLALENQWRLMQAWQDRIAVSNVEAAR
ncbi:hypothetical protein [Bradyrhizobium sp. BRP56]|uniref:hypothetical protein n=1 Tax=Bradyrhizobium sp. BRP56 TaxID=2793819 RepID=UPI001CD28560|nr:hypothetical protein [Bradyrhizobium sp. BRP56]MCA1402356.1 hypothetical protein [Bradyrhizobium sp. BRP56]